MRKILNKIIFKLKNLSCKMGSNIIISRKTKVGNNCKLGKYCTLSKTVRLGNNVYIGPYSKLRKISINDHSVIESGVRIVGTKKGSITIGKNCYIGLNNVLDTNYNWQLCAYCGTFISIMVSFNG